MGFNSRHILLEENGQTIKVTTKVDSNNYEPLFELSANGDHQDLEMEYWVVIILYMEN